MLAVADGTVVSIQDGKPETTPNVAMIPETKEDYGGNHVILEIAPNVFALYVHLHTGSVTVKAGDVVKAGAPLAKIGNTGPSLGPTCISGFPTSPTFRRTEPAFRLRQLHHGRRGRFRHIGGGSRGDHAGFAAGSVRLSALWAASRITRSARR